MPENTTLPNPVIAGSTPPVKEVPRAPKRDLGEYFGEKPAAPPPKAPEPVKEPAAAQEPPQEAPKPPAEAKTADPVPEAPKAEPEAKDDLDSLIESAAPKKPVAAQPVEDTPAAPKELRSAYEKLRTEHAKLKADAEKFHMEQNGNGDLKKAFEDLKSERDKLAERLAYAAYTESPDYENRFAKPTQESYASALELAGRLKNQLVERAGNAQDIQLLYNLYQTDISAASEKAEEMFGRAGDRILGKIEQFDQLEKQRIMAVEDWRKNATTRQTQQKLEMEKARANAMGIWKDQLDRERATRPDLYDFSADPKLSELSKRAEAFAEAAFLPDPTMPQEDVIRHQAKVRMLAGSAIPLMSKLHAANTEIEQLKTALAEYEGSKPKVKASGESSRAEKRKGLSAIEDYFRQD